MPHHPLLGERYALFGGSDERSIHCYAMHHRITALVSVYREEAHAVVLQGQSIQNKQIVRGQECLTVFALQKPVAEHFRKLAGDTRIESLVEVINCKEFWRFRVSR